MNDQRTPLERDQDAAIGRWLDALPERAPERAVGSTIDALRDAHQPRRVVLSMSLPAAAVVALLAVVLIGGLALRGLGPLPAASATPATSGRCSLEQVVGGSHTFYVGVGFAPDTDVVLEIDRANGQHLTIGRSAISSLHTDSQGRFGVELTPFSEDVGTGHVTAIAGCSSGTSYIVTADQLAPSCANPAEAQPLVDTAAYRAAVSADAPANWWHFDEPEGPLAADAVGASEGEWQGSTSALAGLDGTNALSLTGDGGSYIAIPSLTLADEFTIEAWVLLCDYIDNQDALVGNSEDPPDINFHDSRIRLFVGEAEGNDVVIANTPATIGVWEHWAVTRSADGVLRIFRNGTLDATGSAWHGVMRVSEIGRGDAGSLRGAIDELAIYTRALTEAELTAHALAR